MKIGESYRKRYWPFVLWILLLAPGMIGVCVPWDGRVDEAMMLKLMLAVVILALDFLLFLVWRLETVYWINGGPDFETAKAAGSEKRRRFAWLHLKRFLYASLPLLAYLTFGALLGWPVWLDIVLVGVGIIAAALSTIGIHFD